MIIQLYELLVKQAIQSTCPERLTNPGRYANIYLKGTAMKTTDVKKVEVKSNRAAGKIIHHIPRLLEERGLVARDLLYGAQLAPGTAYSLADPYTAPKSIRFDFLARVCKYLEVDIDDILEYVPE